MMQLQEHRSWTLAVHGHMFGSQQWGKDDDILNLINYSEQKREKTYIETKTSSVLGLGCHLL